MPAPAVFPNAWQSEEFSSVLIESLTAQAVLLAGGTSNRILTEGKELHVPRILVRPGGEWIAENADLPTDAGTADEITYTPKKFANLLGLSQESIEDSSVDQLQAVADAMMLGAAQKIDATAFSASAATAVAPGGLLNPALPGTTAASVTADAILAAEGEIQGIGGTPNVTFLNPSDLTGLKMTKNSYGDYIFSQTPYVSTFFSTPAIAKGHAIVCDSRYLNVVIRRDLGVEADSSFFFGSDQVAVRATVRVDFGWSDVNAAFVVAPAT